MQAYVNSRHSAKLVHSGLVMLRATSAELVFLYRTCTSVNPVPLKSLTVSESTASN